MQKERSLKQRITAAIMALVMLMTSLLGTTFAWFTDSVTSSGNVIQTGKLDAQMHWSDELLDYDSDEWNDAEGNVPVFNYNYWEPGYTEVKYVKVSNAGSLNFKWKLNIEANGAVTDLADVIDVYYVNPVNAELESLDGLTSSGKLSSVLANKTAASGNLVAGGNQIFAIAFHMDELAGNEYQDTSLCDGGFSLKLLATQDIGESDSFGDDYDADAQWPEGVVLGNTASAGVTADANNRLSADASMTSADGKISASVPAGALLAPGTNSLTLNVANMDRSDANITLADNEATISIDVHILGIAEDNETVMAISVKELLPVGLNMGNYRFYHVEDGQTAEMTLLADGATPVHNNFEYDPATGDVVLYLKSFSEVALVAETDSAWKGGFDYTWYDASKTELTIANADQLAAFGAIVGGMKKVTGRENNKYTYSDDVILDSFEGQTVKLLADINLGDAEKENNPDLIFYPIGYYNSEGTYERTNTAITSGLRNFEGTFDGNGHTVENFYHNTWEMKGDHNWYSPEEQYYRDGMGLFGRVYKGTIKNLTVKNFSSDGEIATTGVIAAYADGATFENIAIFNCNPRVYNIGNGGIVGCVGWYAKEKDLKTTFTNITVDNSNKISALWGSYDVACGGIVGQYYPTSGQSSANYPQNAGIHFENCHISAQMDVYNDVCANYQYYAYRYAGMLIGSVRENVTIDGHSYPKMDGITAENCTVHFGTWNDYYYCEFEKNGHPSYSGPDDYKFSRIPHSEINFTDSNGNGIIDTEEEKASVTGCKHTHTAAEDNQCVYLEFNNLVTGYGWGVTSMSLTNMPGVENLDITHTEQEKSVKKFEGKLNDLTTDRVYTLDEIFSYIDECGVDVIHGAVNVTITNLDENGNVIAIFTRGKEWNEGTISFKNTGRISITIQDYYFCNATTIDATVTGRVAEEKFDVVMNNGDFLHRVGNKGTVALDKLFEAKDGVKVGTVSVTVEAVNGTSASGTYSNNAIQFNGTGVVKVTITDNDYCIPTELYLEVVDATNVTGLSGTISGNVVLLNDCGLSSLTVSGRNTVYGNGFTATYSGDGRYLNNGLKQGVVTVSENGMLDNLRIVAPIYPSAFMYYGSTKLGEYVQQSSNPKEVDGEKTRYYYQLSAVVAKGNATIQNCYIYGGRTNIFVDTGNVTVKDTVLECGTVANIQIQSNASHTITLENLTTIQHQVNATIGDTSKVMLGAGVIVGPDTEENPKIVLNGYFKQYNWVTQDDADAVSSSTVKMIINGALGETTYNHTINGKNASNLGIIYMNEAAVDVENNTNSPYELGTVEMTVDVGIATSVKGQCYSIKNASENQIYSDYVNADRTTVNGLYQPQFKYDANLGDQHIPDNGGDEFLYREGDTIKVLFPSGDTKVIDLATLVNITKYTGQNLGLDITVKDSSGNAISVSNGKVSLSAADTYTVTYTVTDTLFYDEDGKTFDKTVKYSWNVTIDVSLKDTKIPDAYYEFDTSKQKMGYYKPTFGDVKQYIPFLAGLKIYDYNGQETYLRFDGNEDYNKVASITVTNKYSGNDALIVVKLTDGGTITLQLLARADSGGGSTYTGKIKTSNNTIYFVTDSGTSNKDTTTTAAYWYVDYYKFTGNNGVEITSPQQTFTSTGSSASTPSGSFSTSIKYTVTYDANGGNCGQTTGYATSAAAAVTLPTPTKSGYIFAGWYTAANGGTRVGGAGDSYTPSANITLYAQWGKPCNVTYDANGGSCGTASEKYTGTALTLPTPTRDGYWFVGWYDAAEGGNKIGDAGAKYNPAGEITLYAHWQEAIKYTVTYNANGGSCGTASATYEGTALTLPTPTRTGYTFNGWYTAASGGTKIGDAGATYIPSANITLYAQWEQISYKITVSTSNATVTGVTNGQTAHYGDTVSVTVSFSESNNKTLTVKDASGNTILSKSTAGTYTFTMPASNVTISASSEKSCVTSDTLVMLADGTQKRIDQVTTDDMLLVWNFYTGDYDVVPAAIIFYHGDELYDVVKLYFEDGTTVKVINNHGFYDVELDKFIFLDETNADEYIGHKFVKVDGDERTSVALVGYEVVQEYTGCYSIQTAVHINFMVEGMFSLTIPPIDGWFDYFEIGDDMKYDEEKMQADIEKYGLYEYEVFAVYGVTYEQFIAFNGPYLKVLVGRGVLTFEQILELISTYVVTG